MDAIHGLCMEEGLVHQNLMKARFRQSTCKLKRKCNCDCSIRVIECSIRVSRSCIALILIQALNKLLGALNLLVVSSKL